MYFHEKEQLERFMNATAGLEKILKNIPNRYNETDRAKNTEEMKPSSKVND